MRTTFTLPTDTTIAYERRFDAAPERVWAAYTRPELVRRWLGYGEFVTCEMDIRVGGSYRWEWTLPGFTLGIHGEVLEVDAPHRLVTSELVSDTDLPPTRNVVELRADGERTVMRGCVGYTSKDARDAAYSTGMARGMDDSFTKLVDLLSGPPRRGDRVVPTR